MSFLQVHILCNRDTRTEEDLAIEAQFATLEIPLKVNGEDKVLQEWRPGIVNISELTCMYPHSDSQYTLLHLTTGAVLTVGESYGSLLDKLKSFVPPRPFEYKLNSYATAESTAPLTFPE